MTNVPLAFGHSNATTLAICCALMLSLAPFHPANPTTGEASPGADEKKVFSAMVVFVYASQTLSLILVVSHDLKSVPVMALCHLPEWTIGKFYPCLKHDAALVLPFSIGQDGPILHLNTPMCCCNKFAVLRLHRWVHLYGPVMALPPLYSPDPGLCSMYALEELPMLWTNTQYVVVPSDDDVSEVGHPTMTLVSTSCLEVDANSSKISLTDDEFIQYITIDIDLKGSSENKGSEAAEGEPKVTPKKAKGDAKDSGDSSSNSQDDSMCSDGEGQQPSHSAGFQGWSDDEAEGDEMAAVANIVAWLEQDQHDSGVGMGSDGMGPKIVGIVLEGQVMVDMAAHNKAAGFGATMDHLRRLSDDIIELSRQLNRKMELAALALFDEVKTGFSCTGGIARQFVSDMSKLATDFFMDARVYEAQLDSADTEAFHSTVVGLQEKVDALLGQAGTLVDAYVVCLHGHLHCHGDLCSLASSD